MPRNRGSSAVKNRVETVRRALFSLMKVSSSRALSASDVKEEIGRELSKNPDSSTVREIWRLGRAELLRLGELSAERGGPADAPAIVYRLVGYRGTFAITPENYVLLSPEVRGKMESANISEAFSALVNLGAEIFKSEFKRVSDEAPSRKVSMREPAPRQALSGEESPTPSRRLGGRGLPPSPRSKTRRIPTRRREASARPRRERPARVASRST